RGFNWRVADLCVHEPALLFGGHDVSNGDGTVAADHLRLPAPELERDLHPDGGDLVPMRLDLAFSVDKSIPAHMFNLTNIFTSRRYEAAQTISVANVPFVIG